MTTNAFGRWLLRELRTANISQAELARRAGVTRSTINGVIHGRSPGNSLLLAISNALAIPAEVVFTAAGLLPDRENQMVPGLNEWIDLFYRSDPDTREEMINYARFRLSRGE